MGRTVGELLESIDADELVHWFAFFDIDPWTSDRDDYRNGLLCAVVANAMTGSGFKPDDFIPRFAPTQLTTEVDEDKLLFDGMKWAAVQGGTFVKA